MDERTRALWMTSRWALLMVVRAIEVYVGVDEEKQKGQRET